MIFPLKLVFSGYAFQSPSQSALFQHNYATLLSSLFITSVPVLNEALPQKGEDVCVTEWEVDASAVKSFVKAQ